MLTITAGSTGLLRHILSIGTFFPSPKKKVLQTAVALCQQALREGSGTVSCLFFFHLAAEHLSVRE
jgi:hypothetical protein